MPQISKKIVTKETSEGRLMLMMNVGRYKNGD